MSEHTALIWFAREAAAYFERRDTGGEDMAFWANVTNAENCRKLASAIEALEAERDEARLLSGAHADDTQDAAALWRAAEARCKRLEEALILYERLLLINNVRQAAKDTAPVWLEAADNARLALQENPNGG